METLGGLGFGDVMEEVVEVHKSGQLFVFEAI